MKLSTNFVKDYVDIDVDVKTLAEDMTRVGNEYDFAGNLININIKKIYEKHTLRFAGSPLLSVCICTAGGEPD